MRGRLDFNFMERDSSTAIGNTGEGATVTVLKVGARTNEGATISSGGTLEIDVEHPGGINVGDNLVHVDSSGTIDNSPAFEVSAIAYNSADDDWTITFVDPGAGSWTVSSGDRLYLSQQESTSLVTVYKSDSGTDTYTNSILTLDANGHADGWVECPRVDLYIAGSDITEKYVHGYQTHWSHVVTPEDFGAIGDNSTDDTLPIQKCFNYAMSQEGYVIKFANRTYKVTDTITHSNDGHMADLLVIGSGANTGGTRIQYHPTNTNDLFDIDAYNGSNTATVQFYDMSFGVTQNGGTGGNCLLVKNGARCVFQNLYIFAFDGGAGIKFDAESGKKSDLNRIDNCYIGNCKYGWEVDCSGNTGTEYCNGHFCSNTIFGTNDTYDVYIHNSGLAANNLGCGSGRMNNCWIQCETTASATRGIFIDNDADIANWSFNQVQLDGTSTGTYVTIGANCGRTYWDDCTVDGLIADSSGKMLIGKMYLSTGDKDWNKYRFFETSSGDTTPTINDNTEVLVVSSKTVLTSITTCRDGRVLYVLFTNSAGGGIDTSGSGSNHGINSAISFAQNEMVELVGYNDASTTEWHVVNSTKQYCEMYVSSASASGTITSGTPAKIGGTMAAGDKTTNFTVTTTSGGRITYNGTGDIQVAALASCSFTTSASNEVVSLYIAKNGTELAKSQTDRKVGTGAGADVGAASTSCLTSLSSGDYLEIFADIGSGTATVTIETMNFNVTETD